MAVLPGAADDGLPPLAIVAANRIMNRHNATAALEELVEIRAVACVDRPTFLSVENDHVGVLQFISAGETDFAIHDRAAVFEQLRPVSQKCWTIVLAVAGRAVSFLSRTNEDAQWLIGSENRRSGEEETREEQLVFHTF